MHNQALVRVSFTVRLGKSFCVTRVQTLTLSYGLARRSASYPSDGSHMVGWIVGGPA